MLKLKKTSSLPSQGSLHNINQQFHTDYAKRKAEIKEEISQAKYQLVVRLDDRIVNCEGERTFEHRVVGGNYHQLKAVSHLPLLLHYCNNLHLFADEVNKLSAEAEMDEVKEIAEITMGWVHRLNGGRFTTRDITHLRDTLASPFARVMNAAAKMEITHTVDILNRLKSTSKVPANKTFYIIFGGHQARYRQLSTLIFKKWYSQQPDCLNEVDHYVRYCEGGEQLNDAVELVATAVADSELGHLFLGDFTALNQDVVATAAAKHLDEYWPR